MIDGKLIGNFFQSKGNGEMARIANLEKFVADNVKLELDKAAQEWRDGKRPYKHFWGLRRREFAKIYETMTQGDLQTEEQFKAKRHARIQEKDDYWKADPEHLERRRILREYRRRYEKRKAELANNAAMFNDILDNVYIYRIEYDEAVGALVKKRLDKAGKTRAA